MTEAWEGDRVARWLRRSVGLERQLAPVSQVLLGAAAVRPGERVLDVGCGTGPTTREAAVAAGPAGAVTGLDLAPAMLEAAASVPLPTGAAPVEWTCADAVDWAAPVASYDVVLSRFGVMFFSDPPAAMRTLAGATRVGGRLAFAVWGPRESSPLFEVPYQAARAALGGPGVVPDLPRDEGPYSWHDASTVTRLLESAGWHAVSVVPHVLPLPLLGGESPASAAEAALDFGATRLLVEAAPPGSRDTVRTAVEEALADHVGADGRIVLDGTVRIVTARRRPS